MYEQLFQPCESSSVQRAMISRLLTLPFQIEMRYWAAFTLHYVTCKLRNARKAFCKQASYKIIVFSNMLHAFRPLSVNVKRNLKLVYEACFKSYFDNLTWYKTLFFPVCQCVLSYFLALISFVSTKWSFWPPPPTTNTSGHPFKVVNATISS